MTVLTVALPTLPFVALGVLAMYVSWRRYRNFDGCCPPPPGGGLWVCGHRKVWRRPGSGIAWRRIGKRRYIRLGMAELEIEIEKATRGGRKH